MIRRIHIKNTATFGQSPEKMDDLTEINFIYGSNGTGKTTISRIIANAAAYPDCAVTWRGGITLETLVYNRDFVERNFNQPDELNGIFTLILQL
jgi:Fe-S cluster assembly ATPase SufC